MSETALLIERDFIRKLPLRRGNSRPAVRVLTKDEYDFIKEKAFAGNTDRKKEKITECDRDVLRLKNELQRIRTKEDEIEQLKKDRLSNLEEEQRRRTEWMVARAKILQSEEEEEIKKCNSLIINAKCRTIQDKQLKEQQQIRLAMEFEDKKLDEAMEKERRKILQNIKQTQDADYIKRMQYAELIKDQIKENETARIQEAKRIKNEGALIRKVAMKAQAEEQLQIMNKLSTEKGIELENATINKDIQRDLEARQLKEKLENVKLQENLRKQIERENTDELTKKMEKREKEKELFRLQSLQRKTQLLDDVKNDLINQRVQDQIEREWREKEIETARKKIQAMEEIKQIRENQIAEKRKQQSWLLKQKIEEERKISEEKLEAENKVKTEQTNRVSKIEEQKRTLLKQIMEKEQAKEKLRRELVKEREKLKIEIKKHEDAIKRTMKNKLDEVRKTNMPEKYVKEIEKHLQIR